MTSPRLLGHPLHPSLVHLPIGLLVGGTIWDGVALWTGREFWWQAAFWTLALGMASALPAVLTGLLDFAGIADDEPASARAWQHLSSTLLSVSIYGGSLLVRGGAGTAEPGRLPWAVGLSFLGLVVLGAAGWTGGDLVLRFGLGRADDGEAAPA
ncbi:MAG: DUF2231 domain-containing protein [Gemmatimonadetes bacterium]|nr:DUF2231 domain-containing protein [Gemmatimonadota bacterium]NIR81270.1 DUF2231 domain-containing protein [Gemmatimonadota bacterium]NIT86905.1 DUF2231 domain-containing protein [Gemmatimonadota bacterium]NIU33932.1 DUF2231 domain-containing protein [Gemmatimonadota bacterium]NIU38111.1 DUF2231 domain-containing protein [Gemmatimonadota bacterium]